MHKSLLVLMLVVGSVQVGMFPSAALCQIPGQIPGQLPGQAPAARLQVKDQLANVRRDLEEIEDQMFALASEHGPLITSRDRLWAEMERVQSDMRLAENDLVQSETRLAEMQKQHTQLSQAAKEQLTNDEQLKSLEKRLATLEAKEKRIQDDSSIRAKSKPSLLDSVGGEILDAQMEIAQRRESLTISYLGGQVLELERRKLELVADMQVKARLKELHDERMAELRKKLPFVTQYERLRRSAEEFIALHRRLVELQAQQQMELLRSGVAPVPSGLSTQASR